jgi:hypothetical protein
MLLVLKVKNSVPHDRQSSESDVEHLIDERVIQRLARKNRVKSKPKLSQDVQHVFVEGITD